YCHEKGSWDQLFYHNLQVTKINEHYSPLPGSKKTRGQRNAFLRLRPANNTVYDDVCISSRSDILNKAASHFA
ncbi:hypothetical protein L9F63_012374, partial [Diploptera punctata]